MHGWLNPALVTFNRFLKLDYVEVQAQVANWMNRDDLTAMIPDFIVLTEERMNRDLRTRQMETD